MLDRIFNMSCFICDLRVTLFVVLVSLCGGELCREESVFTVKYKSCPAGCCGSTYNSYCCPETSTGSAVVGIVIGVLVFVGLVVSVIVCCVCCCRRSPGQRGQVIRATQHQVTVLSGTSNTGFVAAHGNIAVNSFPSVAPPYPTQPPVYQGSAVTGCEAAAQLPPPYSEVVKEQSHNISGSKTT